MEERSLPDPIVIPNPRGQWGCFALLCVGWLAVAFALVLRPDLGDYPEWFTIVIGIVAIMGGGWGLGFFLRRLRSDRPMLVVDREGLVDNASAVGAGRVRWDEIEDLETKKVFGQSMLLIHVRDPEPVLRRQPPIRRTFMRLNGLISGTPFGIPAVMLSMSADELRGRILAYLEALEAAVAEPGRSV